MGSRGRFHHEPPRDWGPPPDWGGPYDRPPPSRQGPYDDYSLPPERYFDGPPHQYHNDRPPPHRPPMNNSRGRGRGQNGNGRGQSYSRGRGMGYNANEPKKTPIKEEKKTDSSSNSGKPAWLSNTTTAASTTSSKPAWLTQGSTSTSSSSSDTNSSKPAWLTQVSTSTSSSISDTKPSWLTQTATSSVSSNSKPSWLNTTMNTTVTSNTSTNKPSWMNQSKNNISKPSWLTQSSGVKPIPKSMKNTTNQVPPPPPPATPPPPNQPKIQLPYQQSFPVPPSLTAVMVPSKPQRKIKDNKEVQGTIALPGQSNFISFKNTLQEFCQKKGVGVPSYKSFKKSFGYSATVDLYTGQKVQSSGIQKDKKEAEQYAAYEALKSLGLIGPQTPFVNPSKVGAKRQMPTPQTVAKKLKNDPTLNSPNYKCQLNEFCQKFHLPVPTYETTNSGTGFITKVMYNKKEYSSSVQPTRRASELNASQLVLSKVNQAPPPSEPIKGPVGYPNFVPASINPMGSTNVTATISETPTQPTATVIPIRSMQDLASQNIIPVVSYKNKLQEVCQKQKISLPVYKNMKDAHLHCCELVVQDQTYTATGCKTKKGAEQNAARVALEALGLL